MRPPTAAEARTSAGTLVPDADLRQSLFGSETMRHPAKQSIPQLMHLLRRFAVPGGVLLDPFGGSGCAMLAAAPSHGGMYVVTVELAPHFLAMQQRAWQHFQCTIDMQDIYGTPPGDYWPMLGDSRRLPEVLAANGSMVPCADLIVTSPSYGGSEAVDKRKKQNSTIAQNGGGNTAKDGYVGNNAAPLIPRLGAEYRTHGLSPHSQLSAKQYGYVDTIITSPPYQDSLTDGNPKRTPEKVFKQLDKQALSRVQATAAYDTAPENIGNERGKKYLASMAQVWAGCAHVLRPGGILCCITRDCVKDGQRVPVGDQNKALIEAAGLIWREREIWNIDRLSFWRILQKRKNPAAPVIAEEYVDIFQMPYAESEVA